MPRRRPDHAIWILNNPGAFALRVLRSFRASQGMLLAGAVANYTLLSLIPLLILMMIALSQFVDEARLVAMFKAYLGFAVPGQSAELVNTLQVFLNQQHVVGLALSVTMIVASAAAFTVLESAMSVIFVHRVVARKRRFLVSALLPYFFIVLLGIGLLIVTVVAGGLAALGTHDVTLFGLPRSLDPLSRTLLYFVGVAGEVLMLTAIYIVMPVGRLSWRQALVGGVTATLLWEVTRHVLIWYFGTISQIRFVYGSFTTAIAILMSVEIAAIVLLLGAQVIAEYERAGHATAAAAPAPAEARRRADS